MNHYGLLFGIQIKFGNTDLYILVKGFDCILKTFERLFGFLEIISQHSQPFDLKIKDCDSDLHLMVQ